MTQLKDINDEDTWLYQEYLLNRIEAPCSHLLEYLTSMLDIRKDWASDPVPHRAFFGSLDNMVNLLKRMEEGDELWQFDGFKHMPILAGRAGYVILRDGKVVSVYNVRMS